METYINITICCSKHMPVYKDIFEGMSRNDIETCEELLSKLDSSLPAMFKNIVEEYGDYIESIEAIDTTNDKVETSFVCGSSGANFLADLLLLFGPHVEQISGGFEHDEEYEEGEIWKFSYEQGRVLLNGAPFLKEGVESDALEISDEYSDKVLAICAIPEGEAPEWVRREWVGLEIPITKESMEDEFGMNGEAEEVISGKIVSVQDESPWIVAPDAFMILKEKSIDAYNWWKDNCPDLFSRDAVFTFDGSSWMIKEK